MPALQGVAAAGPGSALAVGDYSSSSASQTLVLRWNGRSWTRVSSPSPGASANVLLAVGSSSAGNAWAVGTYLSGVDGQALAIHCC